MSFAGSEPTFDLSDAEEQRRQQLTFVWQLSTAAALAAQNAVLNGMLPQIGCDPLEWRAFVQSLNEAKQAEKPRIITFDRGRQ